MRGFTYCQQKNFNIGQEEDVNSYLVYEEKKNSTSTDTLRSHALKEEMHFSILPEKITKRAAVSLPVKFA